MRQWTIKLADRPRILLAALAVGLAACGGVPQVDFALGPTETTGPTPTASPSPTPLPPDELFVCLADEPVSLYVYGDTNRAADVILSAVYDGPVDWLGFEPVAVILEQIPSISDGSVRVETVTVAAGDVYVDPISLEPQTLSRGQMFLPPGCHEMACVSEYGSGQIEMERMVVQFQLRSGLIWSDGEPLTAADSEFAYRIDGHPDSPTSKYVYDRTFSYAALDERTVEWIGLPGFFDAEYPANFWSPLPAHQLQDLAPAELLQRPETNQLPLGWGPYRLVEWEPGVHIRLERNPHYQPAEGASAPPFSQLIFRFVDSPQSGLDQLRTGECDLLDESLLPIADLSTIEAAAISGGFQLQVIPGAIVERIDFGLQPLDPGEAIFAGAATRRALAACIDRPGLASTLFGVSTDVGDSFLPPAHPDYAVGGTGLSAEAGEGPDLLEAAGWIDTAGATRIADGVEGVANGTPLAFGLLLDGSGYSQSIGELIQADLADCGAAVSLTAGEAGSIFEAFPDGPVFGRSFEAALWAWPTFSTPACEMFASWEMPSEANPFGINASGYGELLYDEACRSQLWSPPGTDAHQSAIQTWQAEFIQDLPAIPLFVRPRAVAYASWVCGVALDPSAISVIWNLERLMPCSE